MPRSRPLTTCPTSTIQWGNQLTPYVVPKAGSTLLIPPGPGALVEVLPAETPTAFAARLHLDPAVILDYNALSSNSPMLAGSYLQVPLSRAPAGALIASYFVDAQNGVPSVPPQDTLHDGFPYGQCTYYVATRRAVDWSGNAIDWWRAARGKRPEGRVPSQGAIVVFNIGWVGHVAYVEHVNLDGTFMISEMNYHADGGGWGRVDYRTISVSDRLDRRIYLLRASGTPCGRARGDGSTSAQHLARSLVRATKLSRSSRELQIR